MAIKKCIICENCRKLIHGNAQGKCPICSNTYTGKEVGIPVITKLQIDGRCPLPDETEKLKNMPFARKPISAGERNNGIRNIIIGLIVPPLLVLFGLWVINSFVGIGVIFFGYGSLLAAPIFAILFIGSWGINVLVRDPRKKNIDDAFKWAWKESYKNALENEQEDHYRYAYGCVIRSVPDIISDKMSEETLKDYLSETRNVFRTIMDETSKGIDTICYWKDGSAVIGWKKSWELAEDSIHLNSKNEIENGICKATGCFTIKKVFSLIEGENTYELHVAAVSVKINGYYIRNGEYWYPYDLMPGITK